MAGIAPAAHLGLWPETGKPYRHKSQYRPGKQAIFACSALSAWRAKGHSKHVAIIGGREMRLKFLATVCLLVLTVGSANAVTFDWSLSGEADFGITGSGTLTAHEIGGQYNVDSISGAVSANCTGSPCLPLYRNITGLLTPHQTYASISDIGGDNLIFPAPASPFLDNQGLVFSVGGTSGDPCPFPSGCYMNIFYSGGTPQYSLLVSNAGVNLVDFVLTAEVATTPVPAALPLLATGLGVVGWLARHRKRKTLAFAAA